jgi:hypothetical protein
MSPGRKIASVLLLVFGTALAALSLLLIAAPFVPEAPGERSGDLPMYGALGGIFVLPFATTLVLAGLALCRKWRHTNLVLWAPALCAFLELFVAWSLN